MNEEQYPKKRLFKAWNIANVLHLLFPKKDYKTIDIFYPNGWSNCDVTIDNFFIADTNDSVNWDTLKFPLPKPTYKWQIRSYGGTLGEKHNKLFVILIDKA